ncbi:MAG: slipin family protein [Candidatus Zixiibacteriota bacterium]
MAIYTVPIIIVVFLLLSAIRILKEYERGVVFRLGRVIGKKGPGLIILVPMIDKMVKISLRTVVLDVPPQDIITMDNVSVKVNAVVYFRVFDPIRSVVDVENYLYATQQLAQTTLRSVLGEVEMDDLLSKRDQINSKLQDIIDKASDSWGIKVSMVEIKHVDLPEEMRRAMAAQAEAERNRRAKVINAEGEFQASQRLSDAARILNENKGAMLLRYLDTVNNIAAENNSTTLFPIPIDLFKPFIDMAKSVTDKKSD